MSGLVLDSSAAVSWFFEDEAKPKNIAWMVRVSAEGATVPALWRWEIANVLAMSERKGRLTIAETAQAIEMLDTFPISIDQECTAKAFRETVQIARAHKLTVYDASYLELALRLGGELATLDGDLRAAAIATGVRLA